MTHRATREPVYESLNALNHDFECVLTELARLHELGMFNRDLANILRIVVQETRAWANFELVEILQQQEQDDWARFGGCTTGGRRSCKTPTTCSSKRSA